MFLFFNKANKSRSTDYSTSRSFERSENRWVLMLDQAAPGGLIKYNPHSHVARLLPPVKRAIFFTKTISSDKLISSLSVRSQTRSSIVKCWKIFQSRYRVVLCIQIFGFSLFFLTFLVDEFNYLRIQVHIIIILFYSVVSYSFSFFY